VLLRKLDETDFTEVPLVEGSTGNARGIGVADMAAAIRAGRAHRASGELAFHVLEAMHAFHDASAEGKHYGMTSRCDKPAPLTDSAEL
jgi:hypothetical protein